MYNHSKIKIAMKGVVVLQIISNFVNSRRCQGEDGTEMYTNIKRTCRASQRSLSHHLKPGRKKEHHKTVGLNSTNNGSARPARAFDILIHFFAVFVLTTT